MKSLSEYSKHYEMTVGLEVHVELKTKTKIFCACPTDFGAEPNTQCCPICMGAPGVLPTLNARAVEYAIKAGLALNCEIARECGFDRKNYFYPDLPKAYQITQLDFPLCKNGYLEIETNRDKKRIKIERIHLEEDAGKLIHSSGCTMIDHNRCGVPLIEIVSAPEISSPEEAREYLKALRLVMLYAGISDCKMNEGSLRCDVNISVKKRGDSALGLRCEVKNINSFAFAGAAIEYEFCRQCEILEAGGRVPQETRRFDEKSGKTHAMRTKESSADYKYFPEPDISWIKITDADIEKAARELPKMPRERREEYASRFGLDQSASDILTSDRALADLFEASAALTDHVKSLSNLIISELPRLYAEDTLRYISPKSLAELVTLYGERRINSSTEKKLLLRILDSDESPAQIVEREGLAQITDRETLREHLLAVIKENPKSAADYRGGKSSALSFIVGKAMALSRGKADPEILQELARELLSV